LSGKEEVEWPVVVPAHTIANPEAVMVVPLNADTALPTVPSPVLASNPAQITIELLRFG
jgi:hypothetical protein